MLDEHTDGHAYLHADGGRPLPDEHADRHAHLRERRTKPVYADGYTDRRQHRGRDLYGYSDPNADPDTDANDHRMCRATRRPQCAARTFLLELTERLSGAGDEVDPLTSLRTRAMFGDASERQQLHRWRCL